MYSRRHYPVFGATVHESNNDSVLVSWRRCSSAVITVVHSKAQLVTVDRSSNFKHVSLYHDLHGVGVAAHHDGVHLLSLLSGGLRLLRGSVFGGLLCVRELRSFKRSMLRVTCWRKRRGPSNADSWQKEAKEEVEPKTKGRHQCRWEQSQAAEALLWPTRQQCEQSVWNFMQTGSFIRATQCTWASHLPISSHLKPEPLSSEKAEMNVDRFHYIHLVVIMIYGFYFTYLCKLLFL